MFAQVMSSLTLGRTLLLTGIFCINISAKDFSDASSCEVTYYYKINRYSRRSTRIFCNKTDDPFINFRTDYVLRYKCDGAEVVYKKCYEAPHGKRFDINDCVLTPDPFNICNDYEMFKYRKIPGNYKNVVLRNGTFGNHHGVKRIELSGNGIQTVESGAFGCLNDLSGLNISNNDIEELPDDAFRCLPKLRYLILSHNRIRVVPKCLRDLSSLIYLNLDDNLITVFPETALHKSARLVELYLQRNAIQKFCPAEISQKDGLYRLYLRGNNITSLTRKCFAKQKGLLWLDIGMNVGLVLSNDSFAGLDKLKELSIDGCGLTIGAEESAMFSDTTRLHTLHLQHNRLREIHSDLFRNLRNLGYLELSFNAIAVLHNGCFDKNDRLYNLDLSNNALSEIKSGQFPRTLLLLSISNNNITNVAETAFHDLRKLETLNMSNNNISPTISTMPTIEEQAIPVHSFKNIFRNLEGLETLDMSNVTSHDFYLDFSEENRNIGHLVVSFNVGLRLDGNSLKNLKNLRTFISRGTNVQTLKDMFTNNEQLEEINMSENKIQEISYIYLGYSLNLRKLDFSWNNISKIDRFLCDLCTEIEYVNLSHNALKKINIDESLPLSTRLNDLDISFNRFTEIQWTRFTSVGNLWASNNNITELYLPHVENSKIQTVHLEDCQIQKVSLHPQLEMEDRINLWRTWIFLARNPVVCDCHAFQLYEYVKHPGGHRRFYFRGLACGRPVELEGREVKNLLPGDFSCEVNISCPETCRCLKRANDHTLVVNCSRRDLGSLPENVPLNTTILDVSYNRIASLDSLNRSIWENVTEIHAEGNFISSLEFDIPNRVNIFYLHDNRLTKLPERSAAITRRALQITLAGNPWSCGCESLELKYFLSKAVGQIPDASEVRCSSSTNSTSNLTLLGMKDQELCPKREKVYLKEYLEGKKGVYISVIAVLSVLVFGLSIWVYYIKNENFVKAVLFTHCPYLFRLPGCRKVDEEDKTFDCFISYGSEDVDVPLAIVGALGKDMNPEFRFCVHDRHWRAGSTISNNIFRSVVLSRKTLIVISQTFVKNRWFYLEFQAALMQMLKDRRDRMIFVIKGEMPDFEHLPRDVRHFLRTRTYLVWGEWWFMEQLRYSLQEESITLKVQLREFLHVILNCLRKRRLYHRDRPEENVTWKDERDAKERGRPTPVPIHHRKKDTDAVDHPKSREGSTKKKSQVEKTTVRPKSAEPVIPVSKSEHKSPKRTRPRAPRDLPVHGHGDLSGRKKAYKQQSAEKSSPVGGKPRAVTRPRDEGGKVWLKPEGGPKEEQEALVNGFGSEDHSEEHSVQPGDDQINGEHVVPVTKPPLKVPLTTVKSPEEVTGVRSPDPESWTVPLEIGKGLHWMDGKTPDGVQAKGPPVLLSKRLKESSLVGKSQKDIVVCDPGSENTGESVDL